MSTESTRLRWKVKELRELLRALENQLTESHGNPWNPMDDKHSKRIRAREILNEENEASVFVRSPISRR